MSDRIRLLDDLGAELARVAAEIEQRPRRRAVLSRSLRRAGWRGAVVAMIAAVVFALGGTAYAIPFARTAIGEVIATFTPGFFDAEGPAPGGTATETAPPWFQMSVGSERLLHEAGGVRLVARRSALAGGRGVVEFWMGTGRALVADIENWRLEVGRRAIHVLGTSIISRAHSLDEHGRVPLFVLVARGVDRVMLRYLDGGPSLVSGVGDGGVVLMLDAWRVPRDLIAYDVHGRAVAREDLSNFDERYLCEKDEIRVCPPTERIRMSWPFTALATGENWMGPA